MEFAIIVPDRGDRKVFMDFCKEQISRFTLKPSKTYFIDYEPPNQSMDIITRVKSGIDDATKDGIDLVFIIESDDFYPANYFERFQPHFDKYEFFGQEYSDYYNIKTLTFTRFLHQYRSSLCTTGFKISALNNFDWFKLSFSKPFLDIKLWDYARKRKRIFVDTGCIGIKHGLGLCGGKGHKMKLKNQDSNMAWLEERTDKEAFEFYKQLNKTI